MDLPNKGKKKIKDKDEKIYKKRHLSDRQKDRKKKRKEIRESAKADRKKDKYKNKLIICRKCKKPGHYANQCWAKNIWGLESKEESDTWHCFTKLFLSGFRTHGSYWFPAYIPFSTQTEIRKGEI